jgi:hypothetical protein
MIAPSQVAAVINIRIRRDRIHSFLSRMRAPHCGSERYNFRRSGVGTV